MSSDTADSAHRAARGTACGDGPDTAAPRFAEAVRHLDVSNGSVPAHIDRAAAFARFARATGRGAVTVAPVLLTGQARRQHIRNTVLEDHRVRLHVVPDAVEDKLDDLVDDPFAFFRGTALLYYRDHAGTDAHLATVPSIGDVHPENFGIIPGADGEPLFSANDFDEAWPAPFTYDVFRGAVGFALLVEAQGRKPSKRRKVARDFVRGYIRGVEACLFDPGEIDARVTADNAPGCLEPYFRKASRSRGRFLRKKVDPETDRFRHTDRITPRPELVDVLRPVVEEYARRVRPAGRPEGFFEVRDVATRSGSGTASRGLPRFWVLVRGWDDAADQRVILEFKLSRASAMQGLVPADPRSTMPPAERIAKAFTAFVGDGDPLYGHADIDGLSFLVRERSPMKVNVDAEDMSYPDLREYAELCGQLLARKQARADRVLREAGAASGGAGAGAASGGACGRSIMERIAEQIHAAVFLADAEEFVEEQVARVLEDHRLFSEDVERGAFLNIDATGWGEGD
ncbi:DUF2252 domain-containing protein [Corynebacterium bovis]|uniref:DUF2252 family protein n=1 Tax=Corynebacterium bovis TaxID=36808 RepID=UPI000F64854F|nr:DUF2252 family protein [Corynebacterium bovis]RRO79396.1 DUF2252 domain-containing protein [Corynebacterium bovis]RRO91892.1 DUF2252 domain-containing protein [Corynebacterium bovis]